MKKVITLALTLAAFNTYSHAQDFYLKIGLGYAVAHNGQTVNYAERPYNGSLNTNTGYIGINSSASLAAGVNGVIGAGCLFNKHIGIELNAGIGIAPQKYTSQEPNANGSGTDVNITQYAKLPILLQPALVLQTGGEKVNVYTRTGISLPIYCRTIREDANTNEPGNGAIETDVYTYNLHNHFSIGFNAAIGVQFNFKSRTKLFIEGNLLSMSLYPKVAEMTKVTANGQSSYNGKSFLSYIPADEREIYFKKDSNFLTGNEAPAYSIPFSNAGIQVGISTELGHNKHKKHKALTY